MITVLGGGPAGASAALMLTRLGHAVRLITKAGREQHLAVSVPPSCAKVFDALNLTAAIDGADFIRSTGNTVWWGDSNARVESFAAESRGWQLDIARLSAVILNEAIAAGVQLEHRMVTEPPPRKLDSSEFQPLESSFLAARSAAKRHCASEAEPLGGPGRSLAGFVLDCTGRAGVIARARDVRRYEDGPRTIALVGAWRQSAGWLYREAGMSVPANDTHTLIESYDDGWMWSVPVGHGVRHVAAMVDPERSALARGGSARQVYLAEVGKSRVFRDLTSDATLEDGPWGWDATQYHADAYAGDGWLLAGDAGSFIDPLSSAGVKKALASAWLAAVTVHTCIQSPSMKTHALAFFDAREREIATHLARESRRFLASAASGHAHPFWDERADEVSVEPEEKEGVRRAFATLKSRDACTLRVAAEVGIESRPCIRGHVIALEPHVITPARPSGIRYEHGIDLVALLTLAPRCATVPDLFSAYEQHTGPAPLDDFLMALSIAVSRGWLVAE